MPPMIGERSPAPAALIEAAGEGTIELGRERRNWSLDSIISISRPFRPGKNSSDDTD